MKKFIITLAAVAVVVCSAFSVSAASKDQIIAKLKEVPTISNNTSVYDTAVRLVKEGNFTEAQLDKLIPILDDVKKVLPENKGVSSKNYSKEQVSQIITLLDQACEITGYSYKANSTQGGITVYDANKQVAVEYTGSVVKKTGEANANSMTYVYLAAGILVLASAAAVVVVRKENA